MQILGMISLITYSIQFNSIYFPSKQQTHLKKNTQDGGDTAKSKQPEGCFTPLQLKNNNKKANITQRQAKHLISMLILT